MAFSENLREKELPKIILPGNKGRMGRFMEARFISAGYAVSGFDKDDPEYEKKRIFTDMGAGLRLVIMCLPVSAMQTALRELIPFLLPDRDILLDITSVKILPMQWMEEAYAGAVIGTHPLFGPNPSCEDMNTALVRGTVAEDIHCSMVEAAFVSLGSKTFWCTASAHDKGTAFSQSLNFSVNAALFALLAQHKEFAQFLTPSLRRSLEAACKPLTEDAAMFLEFSAYNPCYEDMLEQYTAILQKAGNSGLTHIARQASLCYEDKENFMV